MDAEPLQNLTQQSGGVGRWLVTVVMPPREVTYNWNKGGKSGEGAEIALSFGISGCRSVLRRDLQAKWEGHR